jgi:type I restriction enzyme, S subunit
MTRRVESTVRGRVTIGEVIERVNDRRPDPVSDGLRRFVGVDDLDGDDLTLRRWRSIASEKLPPTFRFVFPAGAVLFPTRRPALRKCAVAPFQGVTGEKILVLQTRDPSRLEPAFAPFLLASEGVRRWVIGKAIGSVTPHFRWRDLAGFEFTLPSLKEQRRIVLSLRAFGDLADAQRAAIERLRLLETTAIDSFIAAYRGTLPAPMSLAEMCLGQLKYGLNAAAVPFQEGGRRFIRITDIDDDGNLSDEDKVSVEVDNPADYILSEGDLLLSRTGTVGRAYLATGREGAAIVAGYLIRCVPDRRIVEPQFLFHYTRASIFRRWVARVSHSGVQANINAKEYASCPVWLPDLAQQRAMIAYVGELRRARRVLEQRMAAAFSVRTEFVSCRFNEAG